jgi:hypothetical protein
LKKQKEAQDTASEEIRKLNAHISELEDRIETYRAAETAMQKMIHEKDAALKKEFSSLLSTEEKNKQMKERFFAVEQENIRLKYSVEDLQNVKWISFY